MDRPWLADVAVIPEDGAPPRAMSPPHPDAVGSYGEQAEKWAEAELGLVLRWWQSLALRKILEHDAAGRLVWRQVLASTPRRSGKSILTMTLACWRLVHGELLGEERQTIVHSGQDLQVVGEVMRLGQAWAKRNDFVVRRKNGQEAIEAGESRWLMRSQLAVFGYEIGLGIVDEAWAVPSSVVDDGLEPAQLHRASPQLLLVSTAHRRATSLMRRRLEAALAGLVEEDYTSLLLWWAAPGGAPIGDPETWRKASPFWTGQQLELISGRWERAMRGELDPQADDPDPAEGFKAQYLNLWPPPGAMPAARETRAVPDEVWEATRAEPPGRPVGAAIESTFAGGLAVGMAYPDGRGHVVSAVQVPTMTDAVDQVLASGAVSLVVGKSLLGDPLLVEGFPVPVEARSSTPRQAVVELRRLLRDGVLRHDDSALLDDQVTALFVAEGVDGPRVRSGCRVDAVKAVLWAVEAAGQVPEAPHIW